MTPTPKHNNIPQPHFIPPDDSSINNEHRPTADKHYNLRPRSTLYKGRLTQRYILAANSLTVMEANLVIHPNTD